MLWAYVSAAALLVAVLLYVVRMYLRLRGARVITCPESHAPAGVELDARYGAITGVLKAPELRLQACSRWPERQDCGQECLAEIASAPEACLLRNILAAWYQGKNCVYCQQPIGEPDWALHKPALLSPERKTVAWHDVRPQEIYRILSTHQPVCWTCHITNTFVREHQDMVTDRSRAV